MQEQWTTIIKPNTKWFDFNLKEVVQYKDLIFMFVKRSFTSQYKQTILGPLWFVLNPLVTTFISTIVFGNIAGIESDGVPYFLFHLCGFTLWSYFSTCVSQTSATFSGNVAIMGKVYFPRIIMPISTVLFSMINTGIILIMTVIAMICYAMAGVQLKIGLYALLIPVLLIQTALLGLGVGIIISSLTTKYKDLMVLVSFGLQLWMYATPVVYPVSQISGKLKSIIMLNPMSPIVNNIRCAMLGCGQMEWGYWGLSAAVTMLIVFGGIGLFGKVEKTFMDTI